MEKRENVDNIILVWGAIHSSRTKGNKGMSMKIYMVNSFDCVRHSFLFDVLSNFGFFYDFIHWISSFVSNT
jgi:hypothetical protein